MGKSICCIIFFSIVFSTSTYSQKAFHVSPSGDDQNDGSFKNPFKTISAASKVAFPRDTILVHSGIYREKISPPRGGISDDERIIYLAADSGKVIIKGSEIVKNWFHVENDTWKVVLPNKYFGRFNPYIDTIHGDWFYPKGRKHHTGAVYINGHWLIESSNLKDVLQPILESQLWFCNVSNDSTTIWAQFNGLNPNDQVVEINVRQSIFYPETPWINYLTVSGFIMQQAATPWAPPTAEQIGLIGTNWSKGWIIENNIISYSKCSGISLGKYGDEFDNKGGASANSYIETIDRAIKNGWSKENIGSHIVRNNTIFCCEQAGIIGSLGGSFSTIIGNVIHDIHIQRLFGGAEMAAVKLHGAIDCKISENHIYHNFSGIWLDWMAQGTQISNNLLHDNDEYDLFFEVDHGPFVVDNNLLLSKKSQKIWSHGGLYSHNLIAGTIEVRQFDDRKTPFFKEHTTELVSLEENPSGDIRFFNNIFLLGSDLSLFDKAQLPMIMKGNVFLKGSIPSIKESDPLYLSKFNPELQLTEKNGAYYLNVNLDKRWRSYKIHNIVTSENSGITIISKLLFKNADGSRLRIDKDYFGQKRDSVNPYPGPFETIKHNKSYFKVWPINNKEYSKQY